LRRGRTINRGVGGGSGAGVGASSNISRVWTGCDGITGTIGISGAWACTWTAGWIGTPAGGVDARTMCERATISPV